ncbi:SOS response-associated peptidase [Mesorhizobium sp. M0050]|uniref:hypothetical protein n=1 Tax=Mesorhizobium sp. M0050 TaxID=2956861 RepID=UPI003336D2C5
MHDRQPFILDPAYYDAWLDPKDVRRRPEGYPAPRHRRQPAVLPRWPGGQCGGHQQATERLREPHRPDQTAVIHRNNFPSSIKRLSITELCRSEHRCRFHRSKVLYLERLAALDCWYHMRNPNRPHCGPIPWSHVS